jgi:hypothetical protein
MTTIYAITNLVQTTPTYICDSQETINRALEFSSTSSVISVNTTSGIFNVGTSVDADNLLASNRQAWLTMQTANNIFSINKEIEVDEGVIWENCHLSTEVMNTSTVYHFLNVPHGNHVSAVGLDAARALETTIQDQYLDWCGLGSYQTWTEWPTSPIKRPRALTTSTSN